MTPRTTRRLALGALALTAALTTSACGTTDPSAAVLLGAQSVPIALLEQQVTDRLAAAGPEAAADTREELQRQVLSQLVRGRLLDRVAEEEGVTVGEGQAEAALRELAGGVPTVEDAYRVAVEQAGLDRGTALRLGRDEALRQALLPALVGDSGVDDAQLRAAYEQGIAQFDTVSVRLFDVEDPTAAQAALAAVQADPERFDEIAAENAATPEAVSPDPVEVGRGTSPPEIDQVLFSTPVGEAAVVESQGQAFVVLVTDRRTVTFEQAREQLAEQLLGPAGEQALAQRLAAEAEEVGVIVNPRFGAWDSQALQVVPDEPETSRPAAGVVSWLDDPGLPPVPGEGGVDPAAPPVPAP